MSFSAVTIPSDLGEGGSGLDSSGAGTGLLRAALEAIKAAGMVAEERLSTLEGVDQETGDDIGTIGTRLAALEATDDTHTAGIAALASRATTLEGRATALESADTALAGRCTALEGRATALEARATALEAKGSTLYFDDLTDHGSPDITNLTSTTYAAVGLSITFTGKATDKFRSMFRIATSNTGSGTANWRWKLLLPDNTAVYSNANIGASAGFAWGKVLTQTGTHTLSLEYKVSGTLVLAIRAGTQTDTEMGFLECTHFSV